MEIYHACDIRIKSVIRVYNKADSKRRYYGSFLDCHELVYCVSGDSQVVFNDTKFCSVPDQIVFLPKGPCMAYYADILQDGEFYDIFFDANGELPEKIAMQNVAKNKNVLALFKKLYYTWERREVGYYNRAMSLFYAILAEMEVCEESYLPKHKSDKLEPALAYIHANYADPHFCTALLPELCGISYTYFKKLFLERFCILPSAYIRDLQIRRACELLLTKRFTVTQVAQLCGFEDQCYFSKIFKKTVGVSPGKYGSNTQDLP